MYLRFLPPKRDRGAQKAGMGMPVQNLPHPVCEELRAIGLGGRKPVQLKIISPSMRVPY